ncbi:GFA family protein [Aquisediminimonas profunda]|uniref:GFA family protein n=1 Tax=Aquisediminimonas profunda TaxID=1550733 RepID=UPI001C6284A5|nr:GFA family protein [Aquisediminimonas profunda]
MSEVALCHCSHCRKSNGGAFNVGVIVKTEQVQFESMNGIREYESSPGKFRAFCSTCGSPVYSRKASSPSDLRLRGGLIENLPQAKNLHHIHFDDRWPWIDTIADAPDDSAVNSAQS